jgi:integrase
MSKRSNGEGTVRERKPGQWEARVSWHDDNDKLVRKSFYATTDKLARAAMKSALARLDRGLPPVDATMTFAAWAAVWESTILKASTRKETTKSLYRTLTRVHLLPAPFGGLSLATLRPRHIDQLIMRLSEERGLSESTTRNVYTVARSILDGAVRDGLIAVNPAEKVPRPTVTRREARHLAVADVRALLAAASASRYHQALTLIAQTGLRRGEALGLAWSDIEIDKNVMHVRTTLGRVNGKLIRTAPKTENSRRDVVLTPATVAVFRQQRIAQLEERMKAANQWEDSGLVFTTELGAPVDPRNLLRAFTVAASKAGIEGVGLHTLRHSAATAMLDAGVPLHVVSRILGHSSVAITGDIYGHVSDSTQREAMDSLSVALGM